MALKLYETGILLCQEFSDLIYPRKKCDRYSIENEIEYEENEIKNKGIIIKLMYNIKPTVQISAINLLVTLWKFEVE